MLRPRRALGQVFLSDRNLLEKVAGLCEADGRVVVEIGAGDGRLTELLAKKAEIVYAIEMDGSLCSLLTERFAGASNVVPLHQDARTLSLNEIASGQYEGKRFGVVGNLPYCSFVEIVLTLMKQLHWIEDIRVMSQRELAVRMMAGHGSHEYGRLSVVVQSRAEVKRLLSLPATAFWPKPKVDSVLIAILPRRFALKSGEALDFFESFVTAAFSQRRKKLLNSLAGSADFSGHVKQVEAILEEFDIPTSCRAQDIPVDKYLSIVQQIAPSLGVEWAGQKGIECE